jgi:hypothetical protein
MSTNKSQPSNRDYKLIDGERVRVKYKAFRLPLDLIKRMKIFAAEREKSLESIVHEALVEYLNKK